MNNTRFIVWLVMREAQEVRLSPKVFEYREDARAYATQEVAAYAKQADIFEVHLPPEADEARAARIALAALEMGAARLVETKSSRSLSERDLATFSRMSEEALRKQEARTRLLEQPLSLIGENAGNTNIHSLINGLVPDTVLRSAIDQVVISRLRKQGLPDYTRSKRKQVVDRILYRTHTESGKSMVTLNYERVVLEILKILDA